MLLAIVIVDFDLVMSAVRLLLSMLLNCQHFEHIEYIEYIENIAHIFAQFNLLWEVATR